MMFLVLIKTLKRNERGKHWFTADMWDTRTSNSTRDINDTAWQVDTGQVTNPQVYKNRILSNTFVFLNQEVVSNNGWGKLPMLKVW